MTDLRPRSDPAFQVDDLKGRGILSRSLVRSWRHLRPLDVGEHRNELRRALEHLQDAFLRTERGTAARRAAEITAKVGTSAGLTSAMFGAAALFGTASTGTAIGTLSGAPFSSAALAWIGGSVATGSAIVFAVPLATGFAAIAGTRWAWRKYLVGTPRAPKHLDSDEVVVAQGLDAILVCLERDEGTATLGSYALCSLWQNSLNPLVGMVEAKLTTDYDTWPSLARRRLAKAIRQLRAIGRRASGRLATSTTMPIGVFAATVMHLTAGGDDFTSVEEAVFEAFRRSTRDLENATPEEIGEYLARFDPEQRMGFLSNVKGIYHEIARVQQENSDGDDWTAELMLEVNHPGADILLVNQRTGEIIEKQLKAVGDVYSIERHQELYPAIEVEATTEVAEVAGVASSGFTNRDLTEAVHGAALSAGDAASLTDAAEEVAATAFNAAFITLTASFGTALLAGRSLKESGGVGVRQSVGALKWGAFGGLLAELLT